MKSHILTFQSEIDYSAAQPVNDLLSKVRVKILYTGLNRNNSFISKESVENAIGTLPYIPIVGEFDKSKNNFLGHGGRIIIDSTGKVEIEDTVKAYGVVPFFNDSKPRWEVINDSETGIPTEYLVADAFLWTGRYSELDIVINGGSYQSMEIVVNDADWVQENDDNGFVNNYYKINNFVFTALCILGRDDVNPENSVIPCFEDASIESYQIKNVGLKSEFDKMIAELKFINTERSENMPVSDMVFESTDSVNEDIILSDTNENVEFSSEEKEFDITENIELAQSDNEISEEVIISYELSHDEIRSSLYSLIKSQTSASDEEDYGAWIVSVYEDYFIYELEGNKYYKQFYSIENNLVTLVGETEEVFIKFLNSNEVNEIESLNNNIDSMSQEISTLKEYKKKRETEDKLVDIEKIFNKFSMLDEEDYKSLKDNALDMDLIALEKELAYIAINKSVFSYQKKDDTKTLKVKVKEKNEDDSLSLRYGEVSRFF